MANSKTKGACRWPSCSCRATGVYCSSKPQKAKRKAIKRVTEKQALKKIDKKLLVQNDAAFYLIIWQEREHKCQNCGTPIYEFSILLFHHILPKREDGGFPQYRHCKWNIWILCWQCHDTHDNGNPDSGTIVKLRNEYKRLLNEHNNGNLSANPGVS